MTHFVIGAAKFCCTAMEDDLLRELRSPALSQVQDYLG